MPSAVDSTHGKKRPGAAPRRLQRLGEIQAAGDAGCGRPKGCRLRSLPEENQGRKTEASKEIPSQALTGKETHHAVAVSKIKRSTNRPVIRDGIEAHTGNALFTVEVSVFSDDAGRVRRHPCRTSRQLSQRRRYCGGNTDRYGTAQV